jgi:hypothetical protein
MNAERSSSAPAACGGSISVRSAPASGGASGDSAPSSGTRAAADGRSFGALPNRFRKKDIIVPYMFLAMGATHHPPASSPEINILAKPLPTKLRPCRDFVWPVFVFRPLILDLA